VHFFALAQDGGTPVLSPEDQAALQPLNKRISGKQRRGQNGRFAGKVFLFDLVGDVSEWYAEKS
jgi:hypothetical protein